MRGDADENQLIMTTNERKELNELRQKLFEEKQKYKKAYADFQYAMETVSMQNMAIQDLRHAINSLSLAVDAMQYHGIWARIWAKLTK